MAIRRKVAPSRCFCPKPRRLATKAPIGRSSRPSSKSCARTARSFTATPIRTPRPQQQQAEAALTNGAQVLVLDPVDSKASAVIAEKAKAQGVPVHRLRSPDSRFGRRQILYFVRQRARRSDPGRGPAHRSGRQGKGHDRHDQRLAHRQQRRQCSRPERTAFSTRRSPTASSRSPRNTTPPDWSPDKAQNQMQQAPHRHEQQSRRGLLRQ